MRKLSARWGLLASRRISVFSSLIHIVITSKEGSRKEDVEKKSSLLFLDKYRIFTTIQTVKVKRYLKRWTRSLRIRNHAKLSDFRKITWNELRKLLRLRRNNCEMHIFTFYIRKFNWTKQCRIGKEKIWDERTDYQIIKRSVIDQRGQRIVPHEARNDLIGVPISSFRPRSAACGFSPGFAPVATMLNSRNIISWVQGNCFIARNNGPVFTVGPLITLLLSIALFGDYTWRRFNNDRSPPRFASLNFLSSRKLCFRVIFFREWERGGKSKEGIEGEKIEVRRKSCEMKMKKDIYFFLTIKFHYSTRGNIFGEKV